MVACLLQPLGAAVKFSDLFRRRTERDRFAELVMRHAKERGWPHKMAYDRDDFRIDVGPKSARLFLQDTFEEWRMADARDKQGKIDRLVSSMLENDGDAYDLEEALPQLLPVIRNRRAVESYWLEPSVGMVRGRWKGAYRPTCDALAVGLAIDRANSLALVDATHLSRWDLPFDKLLERAIANLREISPASFERQPGGFYISSYGDSYDCSRLLMPEMFDLLSLRGDPVAVAVARECLVVAGSKDTNALIAMARFVEEQLAAATRPIGFLPLLRKDGGWVIFDPIEPEMEPFRDLRAKQWLWDYETQREAMEGHFARINRDVHVPKIEARKYDAGVFGITTWGQGAQALLPRTDAVAIFRGKDELFFIRAWDHFWAVFGDVLAEEDFYPVRYLTPETIDEGRLRRLERDFPEPDWLPPLNTGTS